MFKFFKFIPLLFCIVFIGDMLATELNLCGPFTLYDTKKNECVNGTLVPIHKITATTPTTTKITSSTLTTQPHNVKEKTIQLRRRKCIRKESVAVCPEHKPICGKLKCCGLNRPTLYDPREQTCCSAMHKVQVYNYPESKFVCCDLGGYERGKQPCLHASQNDRLWKKHTVMKKGSLNRLCLYEYVYVVKAVKRMRFLSADRQIILQQLRPTRETFKLDVATDKYTPRKSLRKSPLIILSNFDRSQKKEFYVYTPDEIYSRGKLRLRAIYRKLRKCRRAYRHDAFV